MLKNAFYMALFAVISWGSYQISYPSNTPDDLYYDGVFFENVVKHIDKITKGPRAVGDYYHDDVKRYLVRQLQVMGMDVSTQKTTYFNPKNKRAAPIRNIIATHSRTSSEERQTLLLLAHYDAAKFSGTGAGDDASGVAVILEVVNALLKNKKDLENDIVVLFTDAEEIGLLGARAFINEQLQNHNIGLIINLEARGTSGPSMMWPETDGGNRAMVEGFANADVPLPVTTSLHYEIYKMLPNDTDLTPFNQMAKINGFNFAFIDDHFNYHTRRDNLKNLSLNTLAHQTFQIHSMVKHFSNADLSQIKSNESMVYFTLPQIGLIYYPIWVTWLLMALIGVTFMLLLAKIIRHKKLSVLSIIKGVMPIIIAAFLSFGWCWLLLKALYYLQPEFKDILQGFPYSGHQIMAALLISSGFITMTVFSKFKSTRELSSSIMNICLWLLILLPMVYFMPGSGFLVWPVLLSVLLLSIQHHQPKLADDFAAIFAVCGFLLLGTLIVNLPIALGIKAIPMTAVFLTLILGLFTPMIGHYGKTRYVILLVSLPLLYLTWHLTQQPTVSAENPHPTSLSYLYDQDNKIGYYFNYDVVNSGWNNNLFDRPSAPQDLNEFSMLYKKPVRNLTVLNNAIPIDDIKITARNLLSSNERLKIEVNITVNSESEILEIFTNNNISVHHFSIEGRHTALSEPMQLKSGDRLLQYYFDGKKQIKLILEISADQELEWQVQSHSLDLLSREDFKIQIRPKHQIQKPFIKSDNIISVQSFTFSNDQ
ncbi:M20/M25/M40 family metallo-hydrolase [Marinicella litoralis]|uniref:Peptidase M28-like protein n=1 Tax=Marinicella litoralis TaxID=644220 RepID=A0A4R6XGC3_9GAMM|nr:M20/M25/M40 family metallo-hydrolase [Marinicella litoralis]TDR18446.1 peptidase M28-like protein [Marinicella litoralis]